LWNLQRTLCYLQRITLSHWRPQSLHRQDFPNDRMFDPLQAGHGGLPVGFSFGGAGDLTHVRPHPEQTHDRPLLTGCPFPH
jgi:hypothetical protein